MAAQATTRDAPDVRKAKAVFRRNSGMLRMYKAQGRIDVDTILRFAAICRVARVVRPYLESLL